MDKRNLAIDAIALIIYLVVANPVVTGIGLHEWLGLGMLVVFFVHALVHADWIIDATKAALKSPSWGRTGNLVLDVFILVAFMVVTVSGLLISGAVLPALGLYADGYYFWDPLHAISAKVLLALLLIHIVVHWKWVITWFKKGKADRHD